MPSEPSPEQSLPELPLDDGPSDRTREAIFAAVMSDLRPVRPMTLRARAMLVLAVAVAAAAAAVVSFGRIGIASCAHHSADVVACGIVAIVAALAIGGSQSPRVQVALQRANRGLLLALLLVAWTAWVASGLHETGLETAFTMESVGCGLRSLFVGALAFAGFAFIWRKTDPWSPRLTGALFGACAGLVASAGVGMVCPPAFGGHALIGHWLAVPILAGLGALVSRPLLAP
jgi:hypothetical protein